MIQAVIFDLDGTLLDTLDGIATAFNDALGMMNLPPHPVASYRRFVGDGVFACAERCLPESNRSAAMIEQLVTLERERYAQVWAARTAAYDGIDDLLVALVKRDIQLAVLSNKDDNYARECIEVCLPGHPFAGVVGYSDQVPHKPDPTGAHLLTEQLGVAPEAVAFVGDTSVDIATARACNMLAVGVLWGFRDEHELLEAGADRIIETPAELLAAIMPSEESSQ